MNFGEQIKQIRNKAELTQGQFADRLHVTRQAISNWENNKNLPDIGMLILISEEFNVSLDELIKGDSNMSNITEKIINDGSENRRARYCTINCVVGAVLLVLGIVLLVIKGMSVEYIDADGILHENFFLLPLGFASVFCSLLAFICAGVSAVVGKLKKKK